MLLMKLSRRKQITNRKVDSIILTIFSILTYIPSNSLGNYIRLGALLFAFILVISKYGFSFKKEYVTLAALMLFTPLLPILFSFIIEQGVSLSILTHEYIRLIFCSCIILVASQLEIDMKHIYIATLLVFLPNFIIQILEYNKFEPIFTFIKNYYVVDSSEWSHLELARLTGSSFRSGSIFKNPNVYMVIPLISLCVFLYNDKINSSLINYVFILFVFVSIFFTGSRTALVVGIVIFIIYLFKYSSRKKRLLSIFLVLLFILIYGENILKDSRITRIGIEDLGSALYKLDAFFDYIDATAKHPIFWIVGSLGSSYKVNMDAEWGYVYSWYGLVGIIWYIKYYRIMYNNNKHIEFFRKVITVSCALVAITASVLLCMPVFSFVVIFCFSNIKEINNDYE